MKEYALLTFGIVLLVFALVAAIFSATSQKQSATGGIWFRAYVIMLVASLSVSGPLCMREYSCEAVFSGRLQIPL
jgi:hypothetical protein